MKKIQISPSILSSNFSELGNEIKRLEEGGADMIHVDVMDGHFVPNLTIGPPVIKALRNYSTLPFDVHLMISPVHKYIKDYADAGADIITIHPEATENLEESISLIKKLKSLLEQNENIIIGGDFNIIPSEEDVHNPKSYENDALFRLEIRKKLRELINLGFHDAYRYIYPDKEGYTFWDYTSGAWQKNNGMRIDHFLVSNSLINNIKDVKINKFPRGRQKPSDHTPIEIELA